MHPNDDTERAEATSHGSERPAYGTRADYLEITDGASAPVTADSGDGPTVGGTDLLDRLHDVYDPDEGSDRDAHT